jgi:hypothetical protein
MTIEFTPELALDLWYQAAQYEIGIVIPLANPKDLTFISARMYEAKKDLSDPRLEGLSLHLPADCSAIYVYKKEAQLD